MTKRKDPFEIYLDAIHRRLVEEERKRRDRYRSNSNRTTGNPFSPGGIDIDELSNNLKEVEQKESVTTLPDDYNVFLVKAIFSNRNLKKVKITCKCSVVFVATVPGELLAHGAPVVSCPQCKQQYVLYRGELARLENFKTIEGVLIPSNLQNNKTWTKKGNQS